MASASHSLPADFANIVRLFPLPNLVLFPGLVQALHIFEPRYRQLMTDSLASDQLISIALLQPPTESDLFEPIFPTICIGKVVTHAQTPDGRFNIILAGIRRARITEEIVFETPYRMAKVELPTEIEVVSVAQEQSLRDEIVQRFRGSLRVLESAKSMGEDVASWLDLDISLGHLCDLVAFAFSSSPFDQQRVLEADNIQQRAEIVLDLLASQSSKSDQHDRFPPDFSMN